MDKEKNKGILGVVFAGGRSTRMGEDKAFLEVASIPLIAYTFERLRNQLSNVIINANRPAGDFAFLKTTVIADAAYGGNASKGPLSGLYASLTYAADKGYAGIISVAVDTPFFPKTLVQRLLAEQNIEDPVPVLAASPNGMQPTFAFWPTEFRHRLSQLLKADGDMSIQAFATDCDAKTVLFEPEPAFDPFFNINTPDDYAFVQSMLAAKDSKKQRIFGVTGWKNNGKTTMTVRLIEELKKRGYKISSIKHAHHDFDIDHENTDSWRHRQAGAKEVAIVSSRRWALMHEMDNEAEMSLESILKKMEPCDLVLVEGFKRDNHDKLEVRRIGGKEGEPISKTDPHIVAIASDKTEGNENIPVFDLNDIPSIADFIETHMQLKNEDE